MATAVHQTWQLQLSKHGNCSWANVANCSSLSMANCSSLSTATTYHVYSVPNGYLSTQSSFSNKHFNCIAFYMAPGTFMICANKIVTQLTYLLKIVLVYILLICLSIGKYVSNFGCLSAVFASCCSSNPSIFYCKAVYCLANYSNELPGLMYRFKTALNPWLRCVVYRNGKKHCMK